MNCYSVCRIVDNYFDKKYFIVQRKLYDLF